MKKGWRYLLKPAPDSANKLVWKSLEIGIFHRVNLLTLFR